MQEKIDESGIESLAPGRFCYRTQTNACMAHKNTADKDRNVQVTVSYSENVGQVAFSLSTGPLT